MSELQQNTSHIGTTRLLKVDSVFKKTDEIKAGLPVYEISQEAFSKILEGSEIVKNIGD